MCRRVCDGPQPPNSRQRQLFSQPCGSMISCEAQSLARCTKSSGRTYAENAHRMAPRMEVSVESPEPDHEEIGSSAEAGGAMTESRSRKSKRRARRPNGRGIAPEDSR